MNNKPVCLINAPINTRSGYGNLSLAVTKSIIKYNKFEVKINPIKWGNCSKIEIDDPIINEAILTAPLTKQPELTVNVTIPSEWPTYSIGKYNIGVTAGIETSVPPPVWICDGCNAQNVNLVLVTSQHNLNVFTGAGFTKNYSDGRKEDIRLTKPIEKIILGCDTNIFHKTDEHCDFVDEILNKIPELFCFIFVGQYTSNGIYNDRKGIGNHIKTFLSTFKDIKNKPALVLKTSGPNQSVIDRYDYLAKINEITNTVKKETESEDLPNVYLLHGNLSDKEMNFLYNNSKIKAMVSFTHGEGWGIPSLEFSFIGKPQLQPNWSAHLDFLNPEGAILLDGQFVNIPGDAQNEYFIKEAAWFDVNLTKASEKLKTMFNHYGGFLKKAEKLRQENVKNFSLQAMDKQLHSILDKYLPTFAVQQPFVLPKLKKIESNTQAQEESPQKELSKIILPKLKKIE